jgi:hypothetical protein
MNGHKEFVFCPACVVHRGFVHPGIILYFLKAGVRAWSTSSVAFLLYCFLYPSYFREVEIARGLGICEIEVLFLDLRFWM